MTIDSQKTKRLSSPLVGFFKFGVPLTIAFLCLSSVFYCYASYGLSLSILLPLVLLCPFFGISIGYAKLTTVYIDDDSVFIKTVCGLKQIPLSDVKRVVVVKKRGLPWATFFYGSNPVKKTTTLLRPYLRFLALNAPHPDLAGLENIPVSVRKRDWPYYRARFLFEKEQE